MTRSGPPLWLEIGSYALVALGAVLPAILSPGHIIGDGVDLFGTFWFYWWIQDCLIEWQDPSKTQLFFFPLGKDIFAHTGNNFLDALIAQPFQWIFGYPRYQPPFVAAVLFGNAIAARNLAGHVLGKGTWAAWGATMLWMLSPFTLFECMTGRFTQALMWFVPPALYRFLRIGEGRWQDVLLCGVFTGLAGWTYWFMGYFLAFTMGWLAIAQLILKAHPWKAMVLGWIGAGVVCLASISPAAIRMSRLAEKGKVPGLSREGSILGGPADVANNVPDALQGYLLMGNEGQPMFTYLVWGGGLFATILFGRDRLRWVGVILVTLAFAAGTQIPTDPAIVMPHYMAAYNYLPFFDRLWFPYRILGITFLAVALGWGTIIHRLKEKRWVWVLPAVLALTTMVEQSRHLAYPLMHRDLTPPQVYDEIGARGGALIEAPFGISRISIAYQPVHGQPVFGGMGENAPVLWPDGFRRRQNSTFILFLKSLLRDPESPAEFRPGSLTTLKAEGFRWVVLDRQLMDSEFRRRWKGSADADALQRAVFVAQDAMIARMGEPWAVEGSLVVWDLKVEDQAPEGLRPTAESLRTRTWDPEEMPAYEEHLRDIGRLRE
ncbi:MAG: hypothetical protein AAFV53_39050 [Myxococcota bacterium]